MTALLGARVTCPCLASWAPAVGARVVRRASLGKRTVAVGQVVDQARDKAKVWHAAVTWPSGIGREHAITSLAPEGGHAMGCALGCALALEAQEDAARIASPPAFVGTADEMDAWLAAPLSAAEAASIVASEDGSDPLVPWPDVEGLQDGGESGSVLVLRVGAQPETPLVAAGGVSHAGNGHAVTLRRCPIAPSCERPAGHAPGCAPVPSLEHAHVRVDMGRPVRTAVELEALFTPGSRR